MITKRKMDCTERSPLVGKLHDRQPVLGNLDTVFVHDSVLQQHALQLLIGHVQQSLLIILFLRNNSQARNGYGGQRCTQIQFQQPLVNHWKQEPHQVLRFLRSRFIQHHEVCIVGCAQCYHNLRVTCKSEDDKKSVMNAGVRQMLLCSLNVTMHVERLILLLEWENGTTVIKSYRM